MRVLIFCLLIAISNLAYGQPAIIKNPKAGEDRVIAVTGKGLEKLSANQSIELAEGQYTGTMECLVAGKRYVNQFDFNVGHGATGVWVFAPSESCSPMLVLTRP